MDIIKFAHEKATHVIMSLNSDEKWEEEALKTYIREVVYSTAREIYDREHKLEDAIKKVLQHRPHLGYLCHSSECPRIKHENTGGECECGMENLEQVLGI